MWLVIELCRLVMELCGLWWNIVDRFDVGLGFVIELNYAGFAINVYMCELVLLNHVNICGRILELTPKNGTNLSNFELTKILPDLTKFQHPKEVQYWFWECTGATAS
jgi:hypothetical protein